jgi:hypothetical protein
VVLEFEPRASCSIGRHSNTWALWQPFFGLGIFWNRVSWTICLADLKPRSSWSLPSE